MSSYNRSNEDFMEMEMSPTYCRSGSGGSVRTGSTIGISALGPSSSPAVTISEYCTLQMTPESYSISTGTPGGSLSTDDELAAELIRSSSYDAFQPHQAHCAGGSISCQCVGGAAHHVAGGFNPLVHTTAPLSCSSNSSSFSYNYSPSSSSSSSSSFSSLLPSSPQSQSVDYSMLPHSASVGAHCNVHHAATGAPVAGHRCGGQRGHQYHYRRQSRHRRHLHNNSLHHSPCSASSTTSNYHSVGSSSIMTPSSYEVLKQLFPTGYDDLYQRIEQAHLRMQNLSQFQNKCGSKRPQHKLIELNILLPNGFFFTMCVCDDVSLQVVKKNLWLKFQSLLETNKESLNSPSSPSSKSPLYSPKSQSNKENDSNNLNRSYHKRPVVSATLGPGKSPHSTKSRLNVMSKLKRSSSSSTISPSKVTRPESTYTTVDRPGSGLARSDSQNSSSSGRSLFSSWMQRLRRNSSALNELTADISTGQFESSLYVEEETNLNKVPCQAANSIGQPSELCGKTKTLAFILEDMHDFSFQSVTNEAKAAEFYDDTQRLCDLNLFFPFLRLVELFGNKKEKYLNNTISSIIGKSLNDLDEIRNEEFNSYRKNMHQCMVQSVEEREALSIENRVLYEFPPELDEIETLTLSIQQFENLNSYEAFLSKTSNSDSYSLLSFEVTEDELLDDGEDTSSSRQTPSSVIREGFGDDENSVVDLDKERLTENSCDKNLSSDSESIVKKKAKLNDDDMGPVYTEVITLPAPKKTSLHTNGNSGKMGKKFVEETNYARLNKDKIIMTEKRKGSKKIKITNDNSVDSKKKSKSVTTVQMTSHSSLKSESASQDKSGKEKNKVSNEVISQSSYDGISEEKDDIVIDYRKPQKRVCSLGIWASFDLIKSFNTSTQSFVDNPNNSTLNSDNLSAKEKPTKFQANSDLNSKPQQESTGNNLSAHANSSIGIGDQPKDNNSNSSLVDLNSNRLSVANDQYSLSDCADRSNEDKDSLNQLNNSFSSQHNSESSCLSIVESLSATNNSTNNTSKKASTRKSGFLHRIFSTKRSKKEPDHQANTKNDNVDTIKRKPRSQTFNSNGSESLTKCSSSSSSLSSSMTIAASQSLDEKTPDSQSSSSSTSGPSASILSCDSPQLYQIQMDVKTSPSLLIEKLLEQILTRLQQLEEQQTRQQPTQQSLISAKMSDNLNFKTISKFLSEKFTTNYSRLMFSSTGSNSSQPSSSTNSSNFKTSIDSSNKGTFLNLNSNYFLLKICGYEQYLVGDHPLICFEYIRNCVSKGKIPQLKLVSKKEVINKIPNYTYVVPSFIRRLSLTSHPQSSSVVLGVPTNQVTSVTPDSGMGTIDSSNTNNDVSLSPSIGKNKSTVSENSARNGLIETNYAVIQNKFNVKEQESLADSNTPSNGEQTSANGDSNETKANTNENYCHYSTISHFNSKDQANIAAENSVVPYQSSSSSSGTNNSNSNSSRSECFASSESNDSDQASIEDNMSLNSWIDWGISNRKLISLWKINTVFRVRIMSATYVNVKDVERIYVHAGIYHGTEPLCEHQSTRQVLTQNPRWDQLLTFPKLYIQDLPLSARLSIALCATGQRRKPQEKFAIAWVNLQLFNYRRCLLTGRISLNLWPMPKGFEGSLNPLGCSGCNPNPNFSSRLTVEFDTFPKPVVYPPHNDVLDFAKETNKDEIIFRKYYKETLQNPSKENHKLEFKSFFANCSTNRFVRTTSKTWILKQLKDLISRRDPFAEMSEQEKDFFWRERHIIKKIVPDALPKVLESVRWSVREEVSQIYSMLDSWPTVSVDVAIILLGTRYIDPIVRSFAIRCLDKGLTDGLMIHYLLQFVQLLKNEPYYTNDLAYLLLRRSLLNRRFGNLFFWHLRSQIHDPIYSSRWHVLLEMYCRGLSEYSLKSTLQQVQALEEIERISNDTINEADRREAIMKQLNISEVLSKVNYFLNPLNISLPLGKLMRDKCRVMDSAKRPLWLEWTNADNYAKYNALEMSAIIFKSGDDLRQDMLTLQVIRIMDLIWRRENLDLKMLPYNCLATGKQVGLIEVVSHAKTVMGIQRCGGRMAALQVDSSKLHKWIKDHNRDNYDNAVDNFTRSCAGYCVATFILGIGDRNPDNIMVNEDGQIFHIDFGHFLGHFKKKFGFNRERVPFVLTYDFLQVISKGAENPLKSKEFESFQHLCYDAYLALHDNASLLISLFMMMLGTGIPELQTLEDIQYLRQTLQVDKSRKEALHYFESQLDEAHGGAWSTKLDWFFHSVKHA